MDYITQMLGIPVHRSPWQDSNSLPLFLNDAYNFEAVTLSDISALFLKPTGALATVNTIQKHLQRISTICPWPVVFELPAISRQRRTSFIRERIAFVVPGKQIYLPFLGIALSERCDNEAPASSTEKLLPSSQMVLFAFILGKNKLLYLNEMTKRFGYSAMTASRAAQQLAQIGLLAKDSEGTQKFLYSDISPRELYRLAKPHLIVPVRKTIYIDRTELPRNAFLSGLTALSKKTMLNPPTPETWGSTASEGVFATRTPQLIDTERQCALELWKYDPRLTCGNDEIDALSLTASLSDTVDERVEKILEQLIAEVL